jgi:hypothetical protein
MGSAEGCRFSAEVQAEIGPGIREAIPAIEEAAKTLTGFELVTGTAYFHSISKLGSASG